MIIKNTTKKTPKTNPPIFRICVKIFVIINMYASYAYSADKPIIYCFVPVKYVYGFYPDRLITCKDNNYMLSLHLYWANSPFPVP